VNENERKYYKSELLIRNITLLKRLGKIFLQVVSIISRVEILFDFLAGQLFSIPHNSSQLFRRWVCSKF